jgi:hypothetical protein
VVAVVEVPFQEPMEALVVAVLVDLEKVELPNVILGAQVL